MKSFGSLCVLTAALLVGPGGRAAASGATPSPAFEIRDGGKAVDASGLNAEALKALSKVDWKPDEWAAVFAVYVEPADGSHPTKRPPVLGAYRVDDDTLRFMPRFPLAAGVHYRAVYRPDHIPGGKGAPVEAELLLPRAKAAEAAVVADVYPSADRLPENQLKFYIHFTAPMSRGEAYRRIHLIDGDGKTVERPFLELGEELWDPEGKRFTLLIDPGRIKRGLKPHEDLGPVLEQGKTYTLVIDRDWPDAEGDPLKEAYRKTFKATAADETPPDPRTWRLQAPAADGKAALAVVFPKPMDHALLGRLLWVTDGAGRRVAGEIAVTGGETRWHFTPREPWAAGAYRLAADTRLEDLAGNTLGRPFEVDVLHPTTAETKAETVETPFEVWTGEAPK